MDKHTRYIVTDRGGFIDTGRIYLGADGKAVELLEWSEELAIENHERMTNSAAALGPEWLLAGAHEWTGIFNYAKESPATDAPGISNEWHWTRDIDPSSPGRAFYVSPRHGDVDRGYRSFRGRCRAVRRVPAKEYIQIGVSYG